MSTSQKITIKTEDGDGEAIKAKQNEAWHVALPKGDFRWHGSVSEIKAEIRRRCRPQEVQFSKTESA